MYSHSQEPLVPASDHYNDRMKEHRYNGKGGSLSLSAPASKLNASQPGHRKVRARMKKGR